MTATAALAEAARLLWNLPASRRPGVLVRALACFPEISLEASFASGPLRAAMASAWEAIAGTAFPIEFLRRRLERRDDATMVSAICGVAFAQTQVELETQLLEVLRSVDRCWQNALKTDCRTWPRSTSMNTAGRRGNGIRQGFRS